jgi:mRNA-degrading endonuclease RelE of RelBE toxin-antitoxin system
MAIAEASACVPFRIEYSPDSEEHLRALSGRQRAIVLDAVDAQLVSQPLIETRNRKPMRPNSLAPWELRVGSLRIYYDVEEDPDQVVYIRAVGLKLGNRVRIGRDVIEL